MDADDVPIILEVSNIFVNGLLRAMPARVVEVKKNWVIPGIWSSTDSAMRVIMTEGEGVAGMVDVAIMAKTYFKVFKFEIFQIVPRTACMFLIVHRNSFKINHL